jgi:hypothetical protein
MHDHAVTHPHLYTGNWPTQWAAECVRHSQLAYAVACPMQWAGMDICALLLFFLVAAIVLNRGWQEYSLSRFAQHVYRALDENRMHDLQKLLPPAPHRLPRVDNLAMRVIRLIEMGQCDAQALLILLRTRQGQAVTAYIFKRVMSNGSHPHFLEMVQLVIAHCQGNIHREWGFSPLLYAAHHRRADVFHLLLQHKADPNQATRCGKSVKEIFDACLVKDDSMVPPLHVRHDLDLGTIQELLHMMQPPEAPSPPRPTAAHCVGRGTA